MTRRLTALAFALALAPALPAADPTATITKGKDVLEFAIDKQLVTKYHVGEAVAKPYFWPLLAPNEVPVTRAWPMQPGVAGETTDHPHQKSAWFCHGDVIPEGLDLKVKSSDKKVHGIDFWAETPGHGTIACVHVGTPKQISPSHAAVLTKNEWRTPDGTKVLDETRFLHLVALPAGRLIVIESELHATVCPITFGDTKEGSMGVRVNDDIRTMKGKEPGVGALVNAAGKAGEKDVWGYQSDWCDYSGPIQGKVAGIAVFDDPKNPFRAAWHARGYGLMAANPFGRAGAGFPSQKEKTELVKIAKGGELSFKYGIYTHAGDAAAGKVAEAFTTFAAAK